MLLCGGGCGTCETVGETDSEGDVSHFTESGRVRLTSLGDVKRARQRASAGEWKRAENV